MTTTRLTGCQAVMVSCSAGINEHATGRTHRQQVVNRHFVVSRVASPLCGTPSLGWVRSTTRDLVGGRRRMRQKTVTLLAGAALAGGLAAGGATVAAPAATAASPGAWEQVAQCESGGDWHINTGNGYQGGLQFSAQTWSGYGGDEFAATADQ